MEILFESSCGSSQSVFCFIESGIHSDKLECKRNRLKEKVIEKDLYVLGREPLST